MAKKQEEKNTSQQVKWPVVKDGKFVCSDGSEFSNGYYARKYQEQINK